MAVRLERFVVIVDFGGRVFFRGRAYAEARWTRQRERAFRYTCKSNAKRMVGQLRAQYPGRDIQEISAQAAWALEQKWEREAATDGECDSVHG